MLGRIEAAGRFGVNLLGHDKEDFAMAFARRDVDRFNSVPGGDHQMLFGFVTGACRTELPPLVYAHRTFGTHSRYSERPRPIIVDQIAAYAR